MPKRSLIITTRRVADVNACIASFSGHYHELIVVDDMDKSLSEKINYGLRKATGDYLIVSNDDLTLTKGSLMELCAPGKVYSPTVNGGVFKQFHAHIFCLPREVYATVGPYDESYKGVYYIDADYWIRLNRAGFYPDINYNVDVKHEHPATTIKSLPEPERNEQTGRDWFIAKWGVGALTEVGA